MHLGHIGAFVLLAAACASGAADAPVTAVESEDAITLSNGDLTAGISRRDGHVASLKYRSRELLAHGGGYWTLLGSGSQELTGRRDPPPRLYLDAPPAGNGGAFAEVVFGPAYGEARKAGIELHYRLSRGLTGLHAWAVLRRPPRDRPLDVGECRMALKLDPRVFDFLSVDETRQRRMPTGSDWDRGERLNLDEARRMTTGEHAGEVEHKYDYSAVLAETPAYGWCGTKTGIGLWMINPSIEYIAGGPTKVELTGHLDCNRGGLPTLLNMWNGSHYGGASIRVPPGASWTKVIGPFLILVNSGDDPAALRQQALARASRESSAWPYEWVRDAEYPPAAGRGAVAGRLRLDDPQAPGLTASNAWVGLVAPAGPDGGPLDWQRDGTCYQYWARAGADGRFTIPHARPGRYDLRAFCDGALGEFRRADVTVAAGATNDLGALVWTPVRRGRQVWQIGIADRTAAEFRHGDEYAQWGLYLKYPQEFPHDVDFVVGASDWRRDWNYCQPPRISGGRRVSESVWTVRFTLPAAPRGRATLRMALCGSRRDGRVFVTVNGLPAGDSGELPDTGVMHRDGIRGYWHEREVPFDATLLKAGENALSLRSRARDWTMGVLYDCLRLELVEEEVRP